MSRATQVPSRPGSSVVGYGAFTLYGAPFQTLLLTLTRIFVDGPTTPHSALLQMRFGLLRVRSPLLAQSLLFSSPPGTEMFQFPGFALWLCHSDTIAGDGLPHSEIYGSMDICSSP